MLTAWLSVVGMVACDESGDSTCMYACAVGMTCQNGECVPDDTGGAGQNAAIGSACTDNAQCASGTCFVSDAFTGG